MAVSEDTLDQRRTIRVPRPGARFLAFVISAVLGAALLVGGVAAYAQSIADRILPGVSVDGIELGGLTTADARTLLTDRLRGLSEGALTLRTSIGSTTIAYADVGRAADVDAMVAAAFARGRGGSWLDETIASLRLRVQPEALPLQFNYDHDRAAAAVTSFAQRMTLNPIDASIVRTGGGFTVIPSIDGVTIDENGVLAAVQRALSDPTIRANTRLDAPVVAVTPAITSDNAEQARAGLGKMVAELRLTNGKAGWTVRTTRVRSWISFEPTGTGYQAVIDRTAIASYLAPIAKKVATPVLDAAFLRDRHGRIVGAKADRAGRALDVPATADDIAAAIRARATDSTAPATIKLNLVAVLPKRTTEQVARTAPLMVMVGSWTTYYQVAAHNGFGANITVPARRLDGTVVQPGQMFDFWGALGEVSFRTGYRLGGAIVGGHSVEGKALAGGICSASTTLFNAALRGGYEIVSRSPHWYYISRYPLGLDATVSGSQSMRFRNDTATALLIRGFASPGVVRFEIWSVPTGRTVTLSRPIVANVVAGFDTSVKTSALRRGTSNRIEWPVDGKDVWVTRTVRDARGRVVHQETYVSHYHRMIGINQIGIR